MEQSELGGFSEGTTAQGIDALTVHDNAEKLRQKLAETFSQDLLRLATTLARQDGADVVSSNHIKRALHNIKWQPGTEKINEALKGAGYALVGLGLQGFAAEITGGNRPWLTTIYMVITSGGLLMLTAGYLRG